MGHRVVLVVPEICAGGYGAGTVRARSAREAEKGIGIVPRFKHKPHNHGSRSEHFNGLLDTFAFSGFHKAHIPSVMAGQFKYGGTN
jgi:hypothetical protein